MNNGSSIANSGSLTFFNLAVAASAAVSASGNFAVTTTFTVNASGAFIPAAAEIISGAGTLTGSGTVQVTRTAATADFSSQYTITTKTLTNLTVEYAGASAQVISALTYGGLKLNNASGVTMGGNATVNGALTLTSGVITTGANSVIISSTGSVSRTSGHVFGNLQKWIATGATSKTYEIGDATNYTPVDVAFASVTVAGNLTAKSTAGDHPNIGSAAINSGKTANRYWTLTNSGITFTTCSATFTFVAGDLDAGASTSNFIVGTYNAGWTYPTVGARTATTTQVTGVASFGGLQLGEPTPSLLKRVFDTSGNAIASGATLAKGALVRFLLYVDNRGSAVTDLRLSDVLDPAFSYVAGTMRSADVTASCATTACTGPEESAILADALAGTALTDAADGDAGAVSGTTIQLGKANAGSARLDIAANKVYAVVFRARMR
jgi:hypothetical protein